MTVAKPLKVDVREDIRNGREPFSRIMQAVSGLQDGQDLLLLAPFEPAPLYAVLGHQGFNHAAKELPSGDWEVRFSRDEITPEVQPPDADSPAGEPCTAREVVEVDARGLEPPQPLVAILEAVAALPDGAELRARTERRPMHLYSHLKERGFCGETVEQADGSFLTHIFRDHK